VGLPEETGRAGTGELADFRRPEARVTGKAGYGLPIFPIKP